MDSVSLVITCALFAGLGALGLTWFDVHGLLLWLPLLPLVVGWQVAASVPGIGKSGAVPAALLLWPAAFLVEGATLPAILYLAAPFPFLARDVVEGARERWRAMRRPGAFRASLAAFFWPPSLFRRMAHLGVALVLVLFGLWTYQPGAAFDAAAWRAGDPRARYRMLDDLMERTDSLRGMSFEEVGTLLGEGGCSMLTGTEGATPRCVFALPYLLALTVTFDSTGIVERVRVDD